MQSFDECTASKICNHTWVAICGQLEEQSGYRLFLDDCDLHEYNCDNNTSKNIKNKRILVENNNIVQGSTMFKYYVPTCSVCSSRY